MVHSSDKLSISQPKRLWGHTSKVAMVDVADRGRAVSISTGEIRVWELQGSALGESVVLPAFVQGVKVQHSGYDDTRVDYLGFDDTRVCVVRDGITVYDFR